jgi:phenylalanyl-tRNA synthetase beta chain
MNASTSWLSQFVDTGLTPEQLADLITRRVATVDAVEPLRADLSSIVVGRVLTADRHPDSDHLWLTTVDAGGSEPLEVICGAPNVTAGTKYPFAPVGATLPGGLKIEKRKIRGRVSNGMLCSSRELGLGTDHEGILPLSTEAAPGTPLLKVLEGADTRLVVDVLANRPDLLSHRGLAREIAAATGQQLKSPAVIDVQAPAPIPTFASGMTAGVRVVVDHATDSPAYMGVVIRGVRIGASPQWLIDRLTAVGVRPINNLVDATNYMLHGFGQPMHAFDLDALRGGVVQVRRAKAGESLVTLDGVSRTLDPEMLVIADAERAQGLAGIMGGRTSEVSDKTVNVFLEVATFDPRRTRRTSRALGLSTDASYRYERGVPQELPADVYRTTLQLILELCGGAIAGAPSLVTAPERERHKLTLRAARVRTILGVDIPSAESARLLNAVGFEAVPIEGDLAVTAPWFRSDVAREIDLIEEVARLRGYETFPSDLRPYRPSAVPDPALLDTTRRLTDALVGLGFLEARPLSFVADAGPEGVRLRNPLGDSEPYLRSDLLGPLSRRAEYNLDRKQGDLRLFEIGTVFLSGENAFLPNESPRPNTRPIEQTHVAALMMGVRRPPHFTEPDPPAFDEWDAKDIAERLASLAFPDAPISMRPGSPNVAIWLVYAGGKAIGIVTRVLLDAPAWARPAYGIELWLETTPTDPVAPPGANAYATVAGSAKARVVPRYVAPPTFPAVERDVSLLVPDSLEGGAGEVERVLKAEGGLLEEIRLVSEYRGPGVEAGDRSVTWRLTFRHPTRTLTEKEVDERQRKLLRTLETELGVRQRAV